MTAAAVSAAVLASDGRGGGGGPIGVRASSQKVLLYLRTAPCDTRRRRRAGQTSPDIMSVLRAALLLSLA